LKDLSNDCKKIFIDSWKIVLMPKRLIYPYINT
jgi:hypothetical protein